MSLKKSSTMNEKKSFPKTHQHEMWNTGSTEKILNAYRKNRSHIKRVTVCPSLPQRVLVYACCPSILFQASTSNVPVLARDYIVTLHIQK